MKGVQACKTCCRGARLTAGGTAAAEVAGPGESSEGMGPETSCRAGPAQPMAEVPPAAEAGLSCKGRQTGAEMLIFEAPQQVLPAQAQLTWQPKAAR